MDKKIICPILSLLLACAILLGCYNGLAGIRQANAEAELTAKLQTLLPGSASFQEEAYTGDDINIVSVYRASEGCVIETTTNGYAGPITMLVGVSNAGKVTGLQVRNMEETLGLGGEILTDWEFLAQFLNTAGDAAVGEGIDAITGATVTSRAVAKCVNSAVGFVTGVDAVTEATSWGG